MPIVHLVVRYALAACALALAAYFLSRAVGNFASGIGQETGPGEVNLPALLAGLFCMILAAVIAFLPEVLPGQGREALVARWRANQLAADIAALPRGETIKLASTDPDTLENEWERDVLRPNDGSSVVLCELRTNRAGKRSLLRYVDVDAVETGAPGRVPEVILATETDARNLEDAWRAADPADIARALARVDFNRLVLDLESKDARDLSLEIRNHSQSKTRSRTGRR